MKISEDNKNAEKIMQEAKEFEDAMIQDIKTCRRIDKF